MVSGTFLKSASPSGKKRPQLGTQAIRLVLLLGIGQLLIVAAAYFFSGHAGVVLAAAIISLAVSTAIAAFVSQRVSPRLSVLVENARRIQVGKSVKTIDGDDEIAEINCNLSELSEVLAKQHEGLMSTEKRVRAVLDEIPVALIMMGADGTMNNLNPTASEMFGESSMIVGKHLSSLFQRTADQDPESFLADVRAKATAKIIELMAMRVRGDKFPVQLTLSPLKMGENELVIMLDMTERYEIQRMRQAFVAMVSHELRTPLTSVSGFCTLLSMGAFGDITSAAQTEANKAEQNIKRLISLINDLLDLEKLESGTISVVKAPCDLQTIFDQSLNAVSMFAQKRNVSIDMSGAKGIELLGDSDRLVQVLVNLISNAVKFSQEGQKVLVTAQQLPEWIEVKVIDQGRGIPVRYKEAIFERFQQVEVADGKAKGGTGLGLPICKAIAEQHGGSIGVESEEGKGSTFWFRIPEESDPDDVQDPEPTPEAAETS
jgi:PAS domain S-box-containing protein